MRGLIVCALLTVASAQFNFWNGPESDRHAGYTFEYHQRSHLLVIRNRHNCYLIAATSDVAGTYKDKTSRTAVEDDIIKHIKEKEHLHRERPYEFFKDHHDSLAAAECRHRRLFELTYTLPVSLAQQTTMAMPDSTMV